MRGFSDAIGSWKTIIRSRRTSRSALPFSREMSWPMNSTEPSVRSSSRTMQRASVDLPQPDSPTMPSVSPCRTSNDDAVDRLDAADLLLEDDAAVHREVLLDVGHLQDRRRSYDVPRSGRPGGHQLGAARVARGLIQVARHEVRAVRQRLERRRRLVPADLHHVRAARVEPAALRRVEQARRRAGNREQLAAARGCGRAASRAGPRCRGAAAARRSRRRSRARRPGRRTSRSPRRRARRRRRGRA